MPSPTPLIDAAMRKLAYLLYQPYKWLVMVPIFGVSTPFFGLLGAVASVLVNPRFGNRVSGLPWARLNAFLTPMQVAVEGREQIDPEQSYVIVANHQSPYDIYVLYGWLGIDFKWVLKQELRKVPGLGIGCEKLGHIYVDRSNSHAAIRSINEAKERIVGGTSVLFFAEGTFNDGRGLRAFKKGAFRMAIDLGLPILPMTIVGTREILPGGSWNLFPGRAKLIVHEPVAIDGHRRTELRPLIRQVRTAVESGLETH